MDSFFLFVGGGHALLLLIVLLCGPEMKHVMYNQWERGTRRGGRVGLLVWGGGIGQRVGGDVVVNIASCDVPTSYGGDIASPVPTVIMSLSGPHNCAERAACPARTFFHPVIDGWEVWPEQLRFYMWRCFGTISTTSSVSLSVVGTGSGAGAGPGSGGVPPGASGAALSSAHTDLYGDPGYSGAYSRRFRYLPGSELCCDPYTEASTAFPSVLKTLWWALVTMTTTGYGDTYPTTDLGRVIGSATMLCGILALSLPAAIIGNTFQEVLDEYELLNYGQVGLYEFPGPQGKGGGVSKGEFVGWSWGRGLV